MPRLSNFPRRSTVAEIDAVAKFVKITDFAEDYRIAENAEPAPFAKTT